MTRHPNSFLADGHERAVAAAEPAIRAEVAAKYAEALRQSNLTRRLILGMQMRQEIRKRLVQIAPSHALY